MAASNNTSASTSFATSSYDTALYIIPPCSECSQVDQLRELYDKAYGKWPPHINLIYPFVAPELLLRAQQQIQKSFNQQLEPGQSIVVNLDEAGCFEHRTKSTIFLRANNGTKDAQLQSIRAMAMEALGQTHMSTDLHLTIGQSDDDSRFSREFLLAKAQLIPSLSFRVGALAILIRDRTNGTESSEHMRLWGIIDIDSTGEAWKPQAPEYWLFLKIRRGLIFEADEDSDENNTSFNPEVQIGTTFQFLTDQKRWTPYTGNGSIREKPSTFKVSSYNVLMDTKFPSARNRDQLLVSTLLSNAALAGVLVLQEVSDEFLSYLLNDVEVRQRYPHTSHAPSSQPEIGPLPSLRNIVILSSFPFDWTFVPFHRRHKGALVARIKGINLSSASDSQDLVVAGIHLSCGLTDGSVAAKKVQLNTLISYLTQHYSTQSWIMAGDFNITTSTYTIDMALRNKSISTQTAATLAEVERTMSNSGLFDAWATARIEAVDDLGQYSAEALYEGEQGATFDPRNNARAAATSGTSNNRPQRYDRILTRLLDTAHVAHFNQFGLPQDIDGVQVVASDHSGIRATIRFPGGTTGHGILEPGTGIIPLVDCKQAIGGLSDVEELSTALAAHHMFPSEVEEQQRRQAFEILRQVILGKSSDDDSVIPDIPMVMVAVGSYGLGVWTSESDIDCLCIGTISSRTFFRLARQRLLKAESRGVRILRKVEASTGTMLELAVDGIPMDLQYCPAARVVERWSEIPRLAATDSLFNLSILSLRKLKPYRDLLYIKRTLPSLPVFRLAYLCIKLWATQRAIYSSKFGYLSGTHITTMLTWVFKSTAYNAGSVSAADLVTSFFHHYSKFDWANSLVFDAFFHKKSPRYHRSAREPMVILGYHTPNSNIAHTATVPGLQVLVKEFKTATQMLQEPGMTWKKFFGLPDALLVNRELSTGASQFLSSYHSFAKIDIQFWGRTLAKGKGLVGWVESRCLLLVVDIHRALLELEIRIWPARFTDSDPGAHGETGDYHGCYLIGISRASEARVTSDKDDGQLARQSLDKVLDRFLTLLRTDEKHYDPSVCWIGISLARPSEVQNLRLDDREWGDFSTDMEPDSDDEEDDMVDLDALNNAPVQRPLPQRLKPTSTPVSTSKLRPASDVLNRLRWDPSLDPSEYIIGYEDRFLGAKETGLEKWKTEQTDEEFIPQHRILYFKKRGSDGGKGEVVWERARRIDKVFGSGAGAGGRGHVGTNVG